MKDDNIIDPSDETATEDAAVPVRPTAKTGDVTRLASDAEIADLYRLREAAPRRRRFVLGILVMTLLAAIGALVYVALSRFETRITWPGEIDNDFNDERKLLAVAKDATLLVFWPKTESTVVSGDGTNVIDVITAVGRAKDVPFHLHVELTTLTNGWHVTTDESFSEWKRARAAGDWTLDTGSEKLIYINEVESGYPAYSIDYYREAGGHRFAGRALYVRHGPKELVVLRELSAESRGRADAILDGYPCLAANAAAVRARFEIPDAPPSRSVGEIYESTYTDVMRGFLSANWREVDLELRAAIVAAEESGNLEGLERTKALYSVFRTKLQNWYVRQCLEFQELGSVDAGKEKQKNEKRRTSIRRETAERLPEKFDCRQRRIANDDWRILE